MNTKYKILLIILLIVNFQLRIVNVEAQTNQFYSLEYSTGTLLGPSHNFIDKYSWRGGHFNGQIFVLDNVAIGFKFGYNNFYSGVKAQVYDAGNGFRLFADTYRYIHQAPFQLGVAGHLLPDRIIKPYLALYLGVCYATQNVYIQDIKAGTDNFGFIITPELGFFLQFGKNSPVGLKASVAYNYSTNQYEFGGVKFKDLQSLNVNIGLSYMIIR
jgi:hypothetical protein